MPALQYHFSLIETASNKTRKGMLIFAYILSFVFLILSRLDYFVSDVFEYKWGVHAKAQFLHHLFIVYFFFFIFALLYNFYQKWKNAQISEEKGKMEYFVISFMILNLIGGLGYLPAYGVSIYPISFIAPLAFSILIAYAIARHQLLDIKVVAAQLLVFIIWALALVNFILQNSLRGYLFTGGSLVFMVIVGILLVKSVIKEVQQREKLEKLTVELAENNEKLQRLDKLKTEFLSFAAHQVKSPMSVVKGYAELILDGTIKPASKEVKNVAQKIKNSANRMINLVNNLLDSRKIEEGRMEYHFEKTDMAALVREITDGIRPLAQEKNLDLVFESELKETAAMVDVQAFSQIVQNLIDNSIKYTVKGWVKINLQLTTDPLRQSSGEASNPQQGNQKYILICVSDSGIGISKEFMSKVFEEFERGVFHDKSMKGTGLGLHIVKQMVLAHKGEVWVESEGEGKGSKFFVKIPTAQE